jgi:hypothetical protein
LDSPHCTTVEVRSVYRILVGKVRGWNAWVTNVDEGIKMDLKETAYEGVGQFNTLRTSDANLRLLRFCITTVKDRWHKIAFLHALGFYALNYPVHKAYINWSSGPDLKKKTWLYFELMIYDKYTGKNTGPQCVKVVQDSVYWCYECDSHTVDFVKAGNSSSSWITISCCQKIMSCVVTSWFMC